MKTLARRNQSTHNIVPHCPNGRRDFKMCVVMDEFLPRSEGREPSHHGIMSADPEDSVL
jgi:hypothetical protein